MVNALNRKRRIAIVEDDVASLELLDYNFLKAGYETVCFQNPLKALGYLEKHKVDGLITDWIMPELDGKQLVSSLKNSRNFNTPTIMVSCKGDEDSVVEALENGINDFMPKPLRVKELLTRLKKLIEKESGSEETPLVSYKNMSLNEDYFELTIDEQKVNLSKSEFLLLALLLSKIGKVFSRHQILNTLKSDSHYETTDRAVDVLIHSLRNKLKDRFNGSILTVHGIGYKLE